MPHRGLKAGDQDIRAPFGQICGIDNVRHRSIISVRRVVGDSAVVDSRSMGQLISGADVGVRSGSGEPPYVAPRLFQRGATLGSHSAYSVQ